MPASNIRYQARQTLHNNWIMSAAVAFIAGLLGGGVSFGAPGVNFEFNFDADTAQEIFGQMPDLMKWILITIGSVFAVYAIVISIIGGSVQLGYAQYLLKQQDGVNGSINDLFSQFKRFKEGFLQSFLRGLYTFLWSLLFIIPGLIKMYSYAMTPFIMAENPGMSAKEAITRSQEMMDGHKWELFWLEFSFIGWSILCVFTLGIGFLFLKPYMETSFAIFYRCISQSAAAVEADK